MPFFFVSSLMSVILCSVLSTSCLSLLFNLNTVFWAAFSLLNLSSMCPVCVKPSSELLFSGLCSNVVHTFDFL